MDDELLWGGVIALHARVEQRLSVALQRQHGLGLSEYRALGHLALATASGLRMQDLAAKVGLNQSSTTRLAGRLIAAGFAFRDLCPDDKRGVYTVITDAGRARHAEARGTYEETLAAALADAASDPELGLLVRTLRTSAPRLARSPGAEGQGAVPHTAAS
ncbi:MarR family transcriptional regulator [Streptomyces sp. AC563]|uniref:MarR family winged helix-turn-helix transcriptional regulator n=1 Tax=Streptomyces buecherae TaxID=2763006 RepID=UPI00164E059A|nr:MarR family transcriptional regulator [Streptomyces buecherae]MBC3984954.1 MarR family transcriptional regulator [Streptomyces buecherae]MBC3988554.1 MarR family transcriptional regulator [Streptomyces buecherae]QNJ41143.1 MarR family transcriptional regulator [Streptomyces buecherae]